ncbi:hypothetical protein NC651_038647 [Populus alba x Populus x berolinensis]|nr:hypothetical protein NC651_038647 [Populus alba x Populus x berolinensis]
MARLMALPLILILLSLSHGSSDARKIPCPEKGNVLLPENLVLNVLPKGPAPPSSPMVGLIQFQFLLRRLGEFWDHIQVLEKEIRDISSRVYSENKYSMNTCFLIVTPLLLSSHISSQYMLLCTSFYPRSV